MSKLVGFDFDGLIHSYTHGWQGVGAIIDPPVPGTIERLAELLTEYRKAPDDFNTLKPVIFSSRCNESAGVAAMRKWLQDNGLQLKLLNSLEFMTGKPAFYWYFDDRCTQFAGWLPTIEEMRNLKPWNASMAPRNYWKNYSQDQTRARTFVKTLNAQQNATAVQTWHKIQAARAILNDCIVAPGLDPMEQSKLEQCKRALSFVEYRLSLRGYDIVVQDDDTYYADEEK